MYIHMHNTNAITVVMLGPGVGLCGRFGIVRAGCRIRATCEMLFGTQKWHHNDTSSLFEMFFLHATELSSRTALRGAIKSENSGFQASSDDFLQSVVLRRQRLSGGKQEAWSLGQDRKIQKHGIELQRSCW